MSPDPAFGAGCAIVVGGSGAIGEAIATLLAERGSDVVITYRSNRGKADSLVKRIGELGRRADARQLKIEDPSECKELIRFAFDGYGSIHSVVHASGPQLNLRYINQITPEVWAGVMATDVNGCFNLVWAILPEFRRRGGGAFVAVTTSAVKHSPVRDILSAAPKSAIEALVRGLAKEEGRFGVRANCVGPGWVNAGVGKRIMDEELTSDAVHLNQKSIPMKRFGSAREVARAAVFLLSSESAYITGQSLAADGGMQL